MALEVTGSSPVARPTQSGSAAAGAITAIDTHWIRHEGREHDLPGMMTRLGDHVHFLHLRNVKRESASAPGSFYEAEHLGGDTDTVALIAAASAEESRRRSAGRRDHSIPMRPDHGQAILDDLKRRAQPG